MNNENNIDNQNQNNNLMFNPLNISSEQIDMNNLFVNNNQEKEKKPINKKVIYIIIGLVIIAGCVFGVKTLLDSTKTADDIDSSRINKLADYKKTDYLKFTLNEKEYNIGDTVKKFTDNGYTIEKSNINNNYINPDTFVAKTFYYEDKPMFLGAMYCTKKEGCTYDEAILIKINFYKDSKVVLADKIKFRQSYKDVKNILGEENGKFYQDEELKVWNLDNDKIGSPYYLLRFDTGGWLSSNSINEIRIGIWWYEGEKEHTIVEGVKNEK